MSRSESNLIRKIAVAGSSSGHRVNVNIDVRRRDDGYFSRGGEKTRNLMNVILIHDSGESGPPARATRETDTRPPVEIQFVCSMIYFPSARIYLPGDALRCILRRHPPLSGLSIRRTGRRRLRVSHPSLLIIKMRIIVCGELFREVYISTRN